MKGTRLHVERGNPNAKPALSAEAARLRVYLHGMAGDASHMPQDSNTGGASPRIQIVGAHLKSTAHYLTPKTTPGMSCMSTLEPLFFTVAENTIAAL